MSTMIIGSARGKFSKMHQMVYWHLGIFILFKKIFFNYSRPGLQPFGWDQIGREFFWTWSFVRPELWIDFFVRTEIGRIFLYGMPFSRIFFGQWIFVRLELWMDFCKIQTLDEFFLYNCRIWSHLKNLRTKKSVQSSCHTKKSVQKADRTKNSLSNMISSKKLSSKTPAV